MPKYETNQQIVGFIRRLAGEFQGFNSQTVPMSGEMIQMLHGQIVFQGTRTFIALFTKPGSKHDTMVLSLPLFHLPERTPESLLQRLLMWNNGATETVHFAVDELMNTVNLVCVRPVDGMAYPEFHYCMSNLVAVQGNAARVLKSEFGAAGIVPEAL